MTSEDATTLLHLRCLWHGTYTITVAGGIWAARQCDNRTRILTAESAPQLRWLLRADYSQQLRTAT